MEYCKTNTPIPWRLGLDHLHCLGKPGGSLQYTSYTDHRE
jgi:hypothetical protein